MRSIDDIIMETMDKVGKQAVAAFEPTAEQIAAEAHYMIARGYLPHDPAAFRVLARFLAFRRERQNKKAILLRGDNGTGKTYWLQLFCCARFFTAQEIVSAYQRWGLEETLNWVSPSREYAERLGRHGEDVAIDDLGTEPTLCDYGTRIEVLAEVIADRYVRYQRGKGKTYISTNLSADQIRARYGDRIASRLAELCSVVEFSGCDKRMECDI